VVTLVYSASSERPAISRMLAAFTAFGIAGLLLTVAGFVGNLFGWPKGWLGLRAAGATTAFVMYFCALCRRPSRQASQGPQELRSAERRSAKRFIRLAIPVLCILTMTIFAVKVSLAIYNNSIYYRLKREETILTLRQHYYVHKRDRSIEVSRANYITIGLSNALITLVLPAAFIGGSLYWLWCADVHAPMSTAKEKSDDMPAL